MVSITLAILACVGGLLLYVAVPIVSMTAPVQVREKVGTFYLKLGAKTLKQFTFVRRVLSGYDILPISVDDEQKLLEVTLSGSTLGEDNQYRYADPDDRIGRLFNKPISLNFELIPAAVDAELSEWGHWIRQKEANSGLVADGGENVRVDPYVEADDSLRLVDPMDFFAVVSNDIDSETIRTAEKKTKQRFAKYDDGVDMVEMMQMIAGYLVGAGGVMGMHYVQTQLIGGGGGGGTVVDSVPMVLSPALDAVVMFV